MENQNLESIYLKDYKAPQFFIDRADLKFELYEDETIVTSKLHFRISVFCQTPPFFLG